MGCLNINSAESLILGSLESALMFFTGYDTSHSHPYGNKLRIKSLCDYLDENLYAIHDSILCSNHKL